MANVVTVEHGNGDVSIGVEIDGTYVPFATRTRASITHYQDRAHDLGKRLEAGNDQAAQDANDAVPIRAKATAKKDEGKGKG